MSDREREIPEPTTDGVVVDLQMSSELYKALERMARVTGIIEEDFLPIIIQNALGDFEWALANQAMGRAVVSLEPGDMTVLEQATPAGDKPEALAQHILPGKERAARRLLWTKS